MCARPGLNWRPPALQTGAPPTELQAQGFTSQRSGCGSRTHLAWRPRLMGPVSDTPVELPAGCAGRARTGDLRLMRAALFQLSHCAAIDIGVVAGATMNSRTAVLSRPAVPGRPLRDGEDDRVRRFLPAPTPCGSEGSRTPGLRCAKAALSQLSYRPIASLSRRWASNPCPPLTGRTLFLLSYFGGVPSDRA